MGERIFAFKSCLLALMCGGLVPVGLAAPAAAADPPGNNGTRSTTTVPPPVYQPRHLKSG